MMRLYHSPNEKIYFSETYCRLITFAGSVFMIGALGAFERINFVLLAFR